MAWKGMAGRCTLVTQNSILPPPRCFGKEEEVNTRATTGYHTEEKKLKRAERDPTQACGRAGR